MKWEANVRKQSLSISRLSPFCKKMHHKGWGSTFFQNSGIRLCGVTTLKPTVCNLKAPRHVEQVVMHEAQISIMMQIAMHVGRYHGLRCSHNRLCYYTVVSRPRRGTKQQRSSNILSLQVILLHSQHLS
jgi:hypothetical protein